MIARTAGLSQLMNRQGGGRAVGEEIMAGYSKRSLVEKLGVKPGQRVLLVGEPDGFRASLGGLPGTLAAGDGQGSVDYIHLFVVDEAALRRDLPGLRDRLAQNGMLWISWPKKSARMRTDLTESVVRALGLECRLVDVKVAAFSATHSALKLVIPLARR